MARPPLPLGTHGTIKRGQEASGRWVARTRFRDFDGVTRQVAQWGRSGAEAERLLKEKLKDRAAPSAEDIKPDTRFSVVADLWLREVDESDRATNTRQRYREIAANFVIPGLGGLRVREVTTQAVDRYLRTVRVESGDATAKLCRTVLRGIVNLAVRHGAAPFNTVRDATTVRQKSKPVRALTVTEARALRNALRNDAHAVRSELHDIVDVLLGTGVRIGEVLAIRWEDVDIKSEPATVTISGTIIRVHGQGLTIQEHPKSERSRRKLQLPRFVVDTLLSRQVAAEPNNWNIVFPSTRGTLRDPHNVNKQWRKARDRAKFDWVTMHTFRKSVATLLANTDLRLAADQLGHSRANVTERHYVQRPHDGPDTRDALSAFAAECSDDFSGENVE